MAKIMLSRIFALDNSYWYKNHFYILYLSVITPRGTCLVLIKFLKKLFIGSRMKHLLVRSPKVRKMFKVNS